MSNTFARSVEDRFAAVNWEAAPNGSPVFADVAAWFDCAMAQVIDAGDHVILIGRIMASPIVASMDLGTRGEAISRRPWQARRSPRRLKVRSDSARCSKAKGAVFLLGDEALSLPGCTLDGGDPAKTLTRASSGTDWTDRDYRLPVLGL